MPIIPTRHVNISQGASGVEDDDSETSTTNIDQMRRASKRAINLLMRNMKKQQRGVWVPSGRQVKQGKIFHKNFTKDKLQTNISVRS